MVFRLPSAIAFLAVSAFAVPVAAQMADLAIPVTPAHPREFIFTDKGAAHLAGECVGPDTRSYHGFYIAMHEVVDGWSLRLDDGIELGAATAFEAEVTPDRLVRRHRLPDGGIVTETVELFDRENGFRVQLRRRAGRRRSPSCRASTCASCGRSSKPGYEVRWDDGDALLACRQDALSAGARPGAPGLAGHRRARAPTASSPTVATSRPATPRTPRAQGHGPKASPVPAGRHHRTHPAAGAQRARRGRLRRRCHRRGGRGARPAPARRRVRPAGGAPRAPAEADRRHAHRRPACRATTSPWPGPASRWTT